ncbi:hypothetical protein X907_0533 [Glycocaulis alkaliphilus]|uniref:Uncharacterized protein n=1 Tax=Glycocaulis alkaliphilus TaxID=1434191 RepID=A0A3T0E742_9PROT|nr:hypothetical protein X907_0533 [Glycocaulis alkaliphilus]
MGHPGSRPRGQTGATLATTRTGRQDHSTVTLRLAGKTRYEHRL